MLPLPMVYQVNGHIFLEQYPIFSHYCNLAISKSFLPRLTGQSTFSCQIRDLLVLPSRLVGLSIIKLVDQSQLIFDNSTRLTRPLVDLILQQSTSLPFEVIEAQSTARRSCAKQSQSVIVMRCLLSYQLLFSDQ